jgi:hypothetical protein
VAEAHFRVEATDSFVHALTRIETFLQEADADLAFDTLLTELETVVVPNLRRFPQIGQRYLDRPPQSVEALNLLAQLPQGAADALREYLHGAYLILYLPDTNKAVAYLLSIRHHRELSFDFARLWPG